MDKTDLKERITERIDSNLGRIRSEIGHNSDLRIREFRIGDTDVRAAAVFVEGLTDTGLIEERVMASLMIRFPKNFAVTKSGIVNQVLSSSELSEAVGLEETIEAVLGGYAAFFIDGIPAALTVCAIHPKLRDKEEPVSEAIVRGPHIGFSESLNENTALLRLQSGDRELRVEEFRVGQRTKRRLAIAYIGDIANAGLVEEVKRRLRKINTDAVLESGYVEQLVEDDYLSPFPQAQNTERPDRVVGALFEGRVAILLDGTPFALIVPVTFSMMLQSPEDYYERWLPSSLIRLLRYLAAFLSLFAPAVYISFISFHPGMIPTELAISIIGMRDGVPFPAIIEALIMEIAIEILREAGLRLPKPIGPAMGIVGGLVIGEAAVQAGIVSSMMVIVVALTAISSFTVPQYSAGISLRVLRFGAMFSAAIFGLYGITLFLLLLGSHLVKLKSFGVPYLSPAVPYRVADWKDFIVRMPLTMMKRRPKTTKTINPVRRAQTVKKGMTQEDDAEPARPDNDIPSGGRSD